MVARHDQTTDPVLLDALLQARRGTAFFARKLNELTDADLDGVSLLPGWTRRHVVAHVGYNARAIARLVEWEAVQSGLGRVEEVVKNLPELVEQMLGDSVGNAVGSDGQLDRVRGRATQVEIYVEERGVPRDVAQLCP